MAAPFPKVSTDASSTSMASPYVYFVTSKGDIISLMYVLKKRLNNKNNTDSNVKKEGD